MEKQKQQLNRANRNEKPQLRVRSNISAGGSLENCQQNLDYWKKAYDQMCLFK